MRGLVGDQMSEDYGFRGFFGLRTPHDLLRKMVHDHARLAANPKDTYAAFDFFVTANHLVDWIWSSATSKQLKDNRREVPLLRICEHLADGAKHFLLTRPHQGVDGATRSSGAFDPGVFEPSAFDVGELTVELEPAEAADLGVARLSAEQLASRVLNYWMQRIGEPSVSNTSQI